MDRFKNLLQGVEQELSRSQEISEIKLGTMVKNIDSSCAYYGSVGSVEGMDTFPEPMGKVVAYKAVNNGKNWSVGQSIKKNEKYLALATDFSNDDSRNTEYNNLPIMSDYHMEEMDTTNKNSNEFLNMALTALKAIVIRAKHLYNSVDDPKVVENLTEAWVLAKIAVMQDQMGDIHDFVMFSEGEESESEEKVNDPSVVQSMRRDEEENNPVETQMAKRPGLWDNIRKKKEREGKKYKPAKPGDKDRPDSDQWKKLTK